MMETRSKSEIAFSRGWGSEAPQSCFLSCQACLEIPAFSARILRLEVASLDIDATEITEFIALDILATITYD